MTGLHPPGDLIPHRRIPGEIAVIGLINQPAHRILQKLRSAKIHISDPHGDRIVSCHTGEALKPVPLGAIGSSTINAFIKHALPRFLLEGYLIESAPSARGVARARRLA